MMPINRGHYVIKNLAKGVMGTYYLKMKCACGGAIEIHELPSGREENHCTVTGRRVVNRPYGKENRALVEFKKREDL